MTDKPTTAALVIIGNEVLSGRTQDANTQYLAGELKTLGIRLVEVRIIADVEDAIINAVNALRAAHDYVFTTGGIGPTHDDITSASVARAFGVALVRDPQAVEWLRGHYKSDDDLTPERLKMAEVPEGAALVANPISKAPGYRIGNVYVLAGVPRIMQAMFDGIRHDLKGGPPQIAMTVAGLVAEGQIARPLADIQTAHPECEIGSYPFIRGANLGTSVVVRATDRGALDVVTGKVELAFRDLGILPKVTEGEA